MQPDAFTDGGAAPAGGGTWELVGINQVFMVNPKSLLRESDHDMVRIWALTRTGGFGGARLLPDAGGILDQAAVMLDALAVMDAQAAALTPKGKGEH